MSWKSLFAGLAGGKKDEASPRPKTSTPSAPIGAVSVVPATPMLFGKLPQRRDFLRLGAGSAGFERWLEEGLESVRGRGGALPDEPLAFYLPVTGEGDLVGVMLPSRDAVGRTFPLAIFRALPIGASSDLRERWKDQQGFLGRAAALLRQAGTLAEPDLAAALSALGEEPAPTPPSADEIDRDTLPDLPVLTDAQRGMAAPARPLLETLFAPDGLDAAAHALATVGAACDAAKPVAPDGRAAITFEAWAPNPSACDFWLALTGGRLAWEGAPTVLFAKDRIVFALIGAAAPGVLAAYALGVKSGPRHWPLVTSDPALRAKSAAALPARLKAALADPATSLADLAAAAAEPGLARGK